MRWGLRFVCAFIVALAATACVSYPPPAPVSAQPELREDSVIAYDGAPLGLRSWDAARPKAVIIAIHGMNDYSNAFAIAGDYWAARGVSVYAYDQRGFGVSPDFGRWAGEKTLIRDLNAVIAAAKTSHPEIPVYLVGHSMGAGVVLAAMAESPLNVDGVIFAAPGVWGSAQMPIIYRMSLNIAATFARGKTLTGERTGRQSTDNIEILRQMFADPLIIKETRLDAILGVVRVMGSAWRASDDVGGDILVLIGERDEIIPQKSMQKAAARLCGNVEIKEYPEGWHLLFRDLQAELVFDDVLNWINSEQRKIERNAPGPAEIACTGAAS